jgi:hypothetical protein
MLQDRAPAGERARIRLGVEIKSPHVLRRQKPKGARKSTVPFRYSATLTTGAAEARAMDHPYHSIGCGQHHSKQAK